MLVLPITITIIFIILYTMFRSAKWALLILCNVAMAPVGGMLALLFTGTNFSVSSGVGFLALFGVSVQTGVMMTMLVATLGLLPAATSHGIGSDSQRPFAIVIVGGLIAALLMSVFLLPTLYVWIAGDKDVLPTPETEFEN
jgi:cobalt-zinc-cadmium resistance protein CzcA